MTGATGLRPTWGTALRFGCEWAVSAQCQARVSAYNTQAVEPLASARNTRAMPQLQPDRDDFERWLDSRPEDDEPLSE